ncbi:hypothetical protein DPMN_082993 [Dreissena polymorpha]|uniref:Uncharacterized protein n=1 Tax=Dreissena polymorpha TaxID=45954 RepID=A0A9D3Y938_DREPO|nr:hypothetical protein DPMN_082993 [Dreissena polymorpha]
MLQDNRSLTKLYISDLSINKDWKKHARIQEISGYLAVLLYRTISNVFACLFVFPIHIIL